MLLYFFGHDSPSSGENILRSIYTDVGQEVCIWRKKEKKKNRVKVMADNLQKKEKKELYCGGNRE